LSKIILFRCTNPMNFTILRFDTIESTNTEALNQARRGADEGLCVVARQQTAGRGRHGRVWISEKDAGLFFSVVLRPPLEIRFLPLVTLMSAVAVHDTLETLYEIDCDIKWVNDIQVLGPKALRNSRRNDGNGKGFGGRRRHRNQLEFLEFSARNRRHGNFRRSRNRPDSERRNATAKADLFSVHLLRVFVRRTRRGKNSRGMDAALVLRIRQTSTGRVGKRNDSRDHTRHRRKRRAARRTRGGRNSYRKRGRC
jgi:hypothetical protein